MDKIHLRGLSIAIIACMLCAMHTYSQQIGDWQGTSPATISNYFEAPDGYERVEIDDYTEYFRNFPIHLGEGRYYDGKIIIRRHVYLNQQIQQAHPRYFQQNN